jgi:hypothetical protein
MEVIGVGVRRCVALVTGDSAGHRTLLSTLIRVLSVVLLISKESPEEPLAAFGPRPSLHTTLIRLLVG